MADDDDPNDISLPGSVRDEIYKGKKEKCDHCGKEFTWGEAILFSADGDLTFCDKTMDSPEAVDGGCILMWSFKNARSVRCEVKKFQGE